MRRALWRVTAVAALAAAWSVAAGVRALAAGMLRRFSGRSAPVPVPPGEGR